MIGATGRNSGKTELAVQLIEKFSATQTIIGLKVSTYYKGDFQFHGKNEIPLLGNFTITKDTDISTDKNTARMLTANAKEVYWMRTKIEYIDEAFNEFTKLIGENVYIICESNSLRKAVNPGLFLIIINNVSTEIKTTAADVIDFADKKIEFSGTSFLNFSLDEICIRNQKWALS